MKTAERQRVFREEIEPLLDALYSTALRMAGDAPTAEDLAQETAIKAYRGLHQFQPGTNMRAWLFRILRNNLINDYRKRRNAPRLMDFSEGEPVGALPDPSYLAVGTIEKFREEIGDAARRALEKVPPAFRFVFLLSTLEGFSYKEIADVLEIPVGTVMSRLFRARTILRKELSAQMDSKEAGTSPCIVCA
ncbi:MAG: sigma-70 family RNA polymerase sigma factor [Planctomycetota bacterium]|jgi:RNA polymerase sigma-70 factor (ECF subfamily)